MTPKQADKLIKSGQPVELRSMYGEVFVAVIVRRDRWNIYLADGAIVDRQDCEVIKSK